MVSRIKITSFLMVAFAVNSVRCGFRSSPLEYGADFSAPPYLPYAPPPPSHFATPLPVDFAAPLPIDFPSTATYSAPLPVAPFSVNSFAATSHHTFAASPPYVKYHSGFGPFTSYSAVSPNVKFAASSHSPALYSGSLPYGISPPAVAYNGFGGPNTVVKYGPPLTTTTTTYSTAASGAVAPVATPFAAHYASRIGW